MKRSNSSEDKKESGSKRQRDSLELHYGQLDEMDSANETSQQSSAAELCREGCGFYAGPKMEGMCSVCYKKTLKKNNGSSLSGPSALNNKDVSTVLSSQTPKKESTLSLDVSKISSKTTISSPTINPSLKTSSNLLSIPQAANPATSLTTSVSSKAGKDIVSEQASTSTTATEPNKPKKIRCAMCRKRVGLAGFECRCGKIFCSAHRYTDQHDCQFDYKSDAQAKIRKENPQVVGEKFNKI